MPRNNERRRRFKAIMAKLMDGEVAVWDADKHAGAPPKLTVSQVKTAREGHASHGMSVEDLATIYGVSRDTMDRVLGVGRYNLGSYRARRDDT